MTHVYLSPVSCLHYRLHIARDVLIPLTKADIDKASEIMNRPYFLSQPAWNTEVFGDYLIKMMTSKLMFKLK